MRAAVVHEIGGEPNVEDFPEPTSGDEAQVATVLAAALDPVDLGIVNGALGFRQPTPPFVAGYECVVELPDGRRQYVAGPPLPYGALAERAPVPAGAGFAVPSDIDPALAVSVGVPGLAAWLALDRGAVTTGDKVLVLGGGAVGQLVVQLAGLLGAGRTVIADRNRDALDAALSHRADASVQLGPDDIADHYRQGSPDGYDLVIDTLWGDVIGPAITVTNVNGRIVQVGNSAGDAASVVAPSFRNKHISIIGASIFVATDDVRRAAYAALMEHVGAGSIAVPFVRTSLDDAAAAWHQMKSGGAPKFVIEP
jgi:NADPH:quinone reductase